jgi:hypothetical protein
MKNSILNLDGVEVLSKKQMKNVGGGKLSQVINSCASSETCSQGCEITDDNGCTECSGCCIA